MDRYDTNSKGQSPALSQLLNEFSKMPRSAFDETRTKDMDVFPFGIIPVETFLMFPNSEGYLKYDVSCLSKNPTIKRMLSAMSIELRTYKCKCSDLWEGWNNFVTRGRSGNLNMSIPYLDFVHNSNKSTLFPYNPCHYLNIAPAIMYDISQDVTHNKGILSNSRTVTISGQSTQMVANTGLTGISSISAFNASTSYSHGVNALPFVLYAKIAQEYQNSNLLQNNPFWYPENENHKLILPYNCTHASTACYDYPTAKLGDTITAPSGSSVTLNNENPTNDETSMPWLNVTFNRQRKGNYFNTGSPFVDLLRGDVPTLDVLSSYADFSNVVTDSQLGGRVYALGLSVNGKLGILENTSSSNIDLNLNTSSQYSSPSSIIPYNLKTVLNKNTISGIQFNLSEWRKLATMTVFRERMARTDGSYNQMIEAQFQHNPQWHEHDCVYCGGSSQPLVFSEVVQTSADNSATPLGTTAGRVFSSSQNNEIKVSADDYTIFMTVLTVTPNDYYSQGINRMWSELTQSEQYFPILNNLNPQAIKNKELFISGTDNTDEDVFNYQELFSHFKSRQNEVSGLMSLPISKIGDTGAYLFNRLFSTTPNFNNAFVTGNFTDNENLCFSSTEQAQFIMHIASQFKYVAPMPMVTAPSDVGISY